MKQWRLRQQCVVLSAKGRRHEQQMWLGGRRTAGGAMQRKGIEWRDLVRQRGVPSDLPRFGDQIQGRGDQCWHVQRLANVAGSVRTTGMLVGKDPARSEIQEGYAAQYA